MKSKSLSNLFEERETEHLAKYGEAILEKEKKEVVTQEDKPMDQDDAPIGSLPRASGTRDPGVWEELEEEMDIQTEARKRKKPIQEDEEETQRKTKYPIHATEAEDEEKDIAMGTTSAVWVCSLSANMDRSISREEYL